MQGSSSSTMLVHPWGHKGVGPVLLVPQILGPQGELVRICILLSLMGAYIPSHQVDPQVQKPGCIPVGQVGVVRARGGRDMQSPAEHLLALGGMFGPGSSDIKECLAKHPAGITVLPGSLRTNVELDGGVGGASAVGVPLSGLSPPIC